ncbi:hypothetical protein D3C73_1321430 [compost metagenome]
MFQPKHLGPWNLGKYSTLVAVLSLVWIVFISVIMMIPPNQNAAYAMLGMMIILVIMDFAYYRKHFEGPQAALRTSIADLQRRERELEASSGQAAGSATTI